MYLSRPYPIQVGGELLKFSYNINENKIIISYNIFGNLHTSNSIIYLGSNNLNIINTGNCNNYNTYIYNNRLFLNIINNLSNLFCNFIIEI